jgi:hypothetical protein
MKRALLLALLPCFTFSAFSAERLNYIDLVKRLTDLEQAAVLPARGETCAQWSSYDRASRYDTASGTYVAWDANGDGDGYIRKEGEQLVLAEMTGPGCIWRIWSAAPKEGHVRIYLDGASEPQIDLPFMGYFDGKYAPFNRPALVHTVALGWNNYVPIPYAKSCKIVADPGWGQYFQFVYTTFPAGTEVPTFKRALSNEENAALDAADQLIAHAGPAPESPASAKPQDLLIPPGGSSTLHFKGRRAITEILARIYDLPGGAADRHVLRELTLEIRWDGEQQPSVWAPFGDFFGTAAGANPYVSLPSGLTRNGWWYSRWYMPFARRAEITLRNEGSEPRRLILCVEDAPLKRDPANLGRFHAKWHRDAFLPKDRARAIDWTLLTTQGRGRFLGVMLHVWNPRGSWWGEGDEKFFVDGEKFPSTFGTGSEDYFGYAWCNPGLFENAFHNQTISMGNKGHICVNRWHLADNIPFQSGFEGVIEKYFPDTRPTLYASTVYWYLSAGGNDPYEPVPIALRTNYWTELQPSVVKGAIEGEHLKVLSNAAGKTELQDMSGFEGEWSGDTHLWWTGAKPGSRLELAFTVKEAGSYKLNAACTKAIDYGIMQFLCDSVPIGGPVDFFNDGVVPTGPFLLGNVVLSAGEHKLTVEVTGSNPKAVKGYMFGLDYLKLEPGQ